MARAEQMQFNCEKRMERASSVGLSHLRRARKLSVSKNSPRPHTYKDSMRLSTESTTRLSEMRFTTQTTCFTRMQCTLWVSRDSRKQKAMELQKLNIASSTS